MPSQLQAAALTTELATAAVGTPSSDDIGTTVLSCTTQSLPGLGGRTVVLRVVGEIDRLTCATLEKVLNAVLLGAVDEPIRRLVVDIAGVTFCSVQGFALLARTADVAAANATEFALSRCSTHIERCWQILGTNHLDPDHTAIVRYVSTAAAVVATRSERRRHPH